MSRNRFVPVETQGPDIERDEDLDAGDDGIFDDGDFLDEAEAQEGVFEDTTSTFSTPSDPPADHRNALTTREMEARRYEDPKPPQVMPVARQVYNTRAGFKQPKRVLVAKFDQNGSPIVAYFVNGKQVEAFRLPTREELQTLQAKGKLVKGGIGEVAAPSGGVPWKKVLLVGAAAAAAGGAWYLYKKRKKDDDNTTVESVDDDGADDNEDDGVDDSESED